MKWKEKNYFDRAIKLTEAIAGGLRANNYTQPCLWIYKHFVFRFIYLERNVWMNEEMKQNQKCLRIFLFLSFFYVQCSDSWQVTTDFHIDFVDCEMGNILSRKTRRKNKKDLFIVFWHLFFFIIRLIKGGAWVEYTNDTKKAAS